MKKHNLAQKGKRALSMLLVALMVLSCWVWVEPNQLMAEAADAAKDHYLFAYFTGNSSDGQTVHLAVSEDGMHYTALRNNEPVIIPSKGTGAVRDPYIWYNEQDNYYYLICTDMDSADNQWWNNCNGFLMWRSKDLVHWYDEMFINVYDLLQKFNEKVGIVHRAWAPQILWDGQSYIVYFSIDTDNVNYPADQLSIAYFRTTDLVNLDAYYEYGGIFYPGYDVNDADIIQHPTNGKWYLFYKPEQDQKDSAGNDIPVKTFMMVSDNATGPYTSADPNNKYGLDIFSTDSTNPVTEGLEGPNGYFDDAGNLVVYADAFGHGSAYFYVAKTDTPGDFTKWTVYGEDAHNINSLSPRHGSVVKITEEEYNRLLNNAYGITSSSFPATETLEDHLIAKYFTTSDATYNAANGENDLSCTDIGMAYGYETDKIGYYANFNGNSYAKINLYQLVPGGLNYDDGFTITFTGLIYSNEDSRFFSISNGSNLTNVDVDGDVTINNYVHTTSTNLVDSALHDYIISYADGNIIIYKDGELLLKKNRFNVDSKWEDTDSNGTLDYVDQSSETVMDEDWYNAISSGTLYIGALNESSGKIAGGITDFCIYDCSMSYYDIKTIQNQEDIDAGRTGGTPSFGSFGSVVPGGFEDDGTRNDNYTSYTSEQYSNLLYSPKMGYMPNGSGESQNPDSEKYSSYAAVAGENNSVNVGIYYPEATVMYVDGKTEPLMPVLLGARINAARTDPKMITAYPSASSSNNADSSIFSLKRDWTGWTTHADFLYAYSNPDGSPQRIGSNSSTRLSADLDNDNSSQNNRDIYYYASVLTLNESNITFNSNGYQKYDPSWYWESERGSMNETSTQHHSDGYQDGAVHYIWVIDLRAITAARNEIAEEYDSVVKNKYYCPATIEAYKAIAEEIAAFNPNSYGYASGTEAAVKDCSTQAQKLVEEYNRVKANLGGHKKVTLDSREATCTLPGLTTGSYCEYCGEVYTEQTTLSTYTVKVADSDHLKTKATYTQAAEYWLECSICGEIATKNPDSTHSLSYRAEEFYWTDKTIPYELSYDNLFIFSDWAISNSANPGNAKKGAIAVDAYAGTIKLISKQNTESNPHDFYTAQGYGNGHYNVTVEPGREYIFEYTASGGTKDQVHIFFYDDNGNGVANPANRNYTFANAYGSGNGTSTIYFAAPEGATKVSFRFGTTVLGETVTFSNIALYVKNRLDEAGMMDWNNRIYRKVYESGEEVGSPELPSRPGYDLAGMYVDNHYDGLINNLDDKIDEDAPVDSFAKLKFGENEAIKTSYIILSDWTPYKYTIKFDANGGTGTEMSDMQLEVGEEKALSANTYTKTGYTFGGWKNDATGNTYGDGTLVSNLTLEKNGVVTLKAQWKANEYTVTFDGNKGTPDSANKTVAYDSAYGDLPSATRNGYEFVGWFTAAIGGTQVTKDTKVSNAANHTLYAQWTAKTGKVIFNANGGTCATTEKNITFDSAYGDLPTPTRDGYTFNGWFTEVTGGTQVIKDTIVTNIETHTLYAQWTAITYKVTFDANGGTGGTTVDATYDKDVTAPEVSREGYTFGGWKDSNGNTVDESLKNLTTTQGETVTLTAVWQITDEALVPDYVAIDFYHPVEIDPVANDEILLDELGDADYTLYLVGTNQNFSVNGNKITYHTTQNAGLTIPTETVNYTVTLADGTALTSTITVTLASNVYYEENMLTIAEEPYVDWEAKGTAKYSVLNADTSADDIYGYDNAYDVVEDFSNGTYLQANVTSENKNTKSSDMASFEFEGMGFDLIGACGENTGIQTVAIKKWNATSNKYKAVKIYIVDTYYNGNLVGDDGLLHQTPILTFRGETGQYRVETIATYLNSATAVKNNTAYFSNAVNGNTVNANAGKPTKALINELESLGIEASGVDVEVLWMDDNSVFNGGTGSLNGSVFSGSAGKYYAGEATGTPGLTNYIDGFRVYKNGGADYIASEQNPTYYNIVDGIGSRAFAGNFDAVTDENFTEVFGKDFDYINNYLNSNVPKGEIYLAQNEAVAFTFSAKYIAGKTADIMLGMRVVKGTVNAQVTAKIDGNTKTTNPAVVSATEMYYDVSGAVQVSGTDGTVTILVANTGEGTLAVNNLKLVNGELQSEGTNGDGVMSGSNAAIGGTAPVPTPVAPDATQGDAGNVEDIPETDVDTDTNVPETDTEIEDDTEEETDSDVSIAIPGLPAPIASFLELLFKLLTQLLGSFGF